MKRLLVSAVLAASFICAPLAHADSAYVPIGDPYTDTIGLWSDLASALSFLANNFAILFNGHEFAASRLATPSAALAAAAANAEPAQATTITYTVQAGDTLSGIAQSYDIPLSNILAANDLSQGAILHPGENLIIPNPQTTPATSSGTASNTTSDQTTLSQNVKSANTEPSGSQNIVASAPTAPAFNASNFVTQSELTQVLLALSTSLSTKSAPTTVPAVPLADGNPLVPYAAENNITNLSGVTITNANLSASEIPALDYLSLSGGTLTGTLSVPTLDASSTNYGVITSTNASSTNLSNFGTAYFGGTGTTTIDSAGDLSVAGNTSLVNATSSNLSVLGTASTSNLVVSNSFTLGTLTGILHAAGGVVSASLVNLASDVSGVLPVTNGGTGWASLASGYIPFGNGSSSLATSSNLFFDAIDDRLGIGTSSPFATLSVNGSGYFSTLNLGSALSIANGGTGATTTTGVTASIQFLQSTSTAVARTVQSKLSDTISVKDFGATGSALSYSDGTISSGTNTFSSNSATFTSADVGKVIWIDYAGSAGAPLQTTITGFTSSHDVTLGADAVTSVPYSFLYSASVVTAQSGSGSYAPGDTLTLSGGTASVSAVVTVKRTDVVTASLVSGGTGGTTTAGASSGSCVVTGTTGSGERKFSLNVTLTSGVVTAITSIASAGQYSANPTSLSAEPVTGCGSLSGATVSLVMGVLMPTVTTQGDYSATANTLTQASTSGSGTGATFTASFVTGGTFTYGTDDTTAWSNAIDYVMQLDKAGSPACLYAPAGIYLITSSLPTFTTNGCVMGASQNETYLAPAPSVSGDVLSWSDAWADGASPYGDSNYDISAQKTGPTIENIGVAGDLTASNIQNAIAFRDREDNINLNNVEVNDMHGSCMTTGYTENTSESFIRESTIENFRCYNSGTANNPAIDMYSSGSGPADNEIEMDNIDVYAPNGPGIAFRNGGTGGYGQIRIGNLRVEGQEGDPQLSQGDLIDIGSASLGGIVDNVTIDNLELVNPYLGFAALRMTANTSADMPYYITVTHGHLTAPSSDAFGRGVEIDAGRNSSLTFSQIQSNDYNVYVGASPMVGGDNLISDDGNESSLYAYIDPTSVKNVVLPSTFQTLASLVYGGSNNTSSGLNALASVTSGSSNTAFGYNAGNALATGLQNVFVGAFAGQVHSSGSGDTYVGYNAGQADTVGFGNTCVGTNACYQNTNGDNNIALGGGAGYKLGPGSAANIIIGLGNATDVNQPQTDKDTIVIGDQLSALPNNAYARLNVGNLLFGTGIASTSVISTGDISIGTTTPSSRLTIWGADSASSTLAFNVANSASTTVFSVFDGGNAELSGSLSQSSDERLKTNIQTLASSSSLSFIDELNPVTFNWIDPNQTTTLQLGFIAQQVQQIFPNLVSTTSATALTPGGTLSLNYIGLISPIVSAIQALSAELSSIENTITGFAQSFTSAVGNFGQVNAQNELCVGSTCITPAQFQAMVAAAGESGAAPAAGDDASSDSQATDTPPVIQVNGDNPAVIQVGATYNDLGATITGPTADLNLGIQTVVNGTEMSPVQLDTSQAATDTIDYVATDQNGLSSTTTRTVIIEPADAPSIVPTDTASSTAPTSDEAEATTTAATSTSK